MKTKYTKEKLLPLVQNSTSYSEVLRKLDLQITGGNQQNLKKRIQQYKIDISHFVRTNKNQKAWNRKTAKEILIFNPKIKTRLDVRQLRRGLQEIGRKYKCEKCGNKGIWRGTKIVLDIHHIDGNWKNNTKENLQYLCPNCHSQTENYYNKGV